MMFLTSPISCSMQILDQDLIPWDQDSDLMHPEGKCLCITHFGILLADQYIKALFTSTPKPKIFQDSPSHRIFRLHAWSIKYRRK